MTTGGRIRWEKIGKNSKFKTDFKTHVNFRMKVTVYTDDVLQGKSNGKLFSSTVARMNNIIILNFFYLFPRWTFPHMTFKYIWSHNSFRFENLNNGRVTRKQMSFSEALTQSVFQIRISIYFDLKWNFPRRGLKTKFRNIIGFDILWRRQKS
jgi:hypothetical protein